MWSHRRLVLCGRRCIRLQRVNSGDVTLDSSRCFVRKAKKIKMSEQPKPDLGLLEEDDEFEEFPAEDWGEEDEDSADVNVWEDNWDDDNIEDDFSKQLRAELEKQGKSEDGAEPMKT